MNTTNLSIFLRFQTQALFENEYLRSSLLLESINSMFIFEDPRSLHLGISTLLKNCLVSYISTDKVIGRMASRSDITESSMKRYILRGCNTIFSSMQRYYPNAGNCRPVAEGSTLDTEWSLQ